MYSFTSYRSLILPPRSPRGVLSCRSNLYISVLYLFAGIFPVCLCQCEKRCQCSWNSIHRSVYVKRVIFTLGAVSDTEKNREQYRSVNVKRVIFYPWCRERYSEEQRTIQVCVRKKGNFYPWCLSVRSRRPGKEIESQVCIRKKGNFYPWCLSVRSRRQNTRVQRVRWIRTFDIQYRKLKTQVCVQIKGYRH